MLSRSQLLSLRHGKAISAAPCNLIRTNSILLTEENIFIPDPIFPPKRILLEIASDLKQNETILKELINKNKVLGHFWLKIQIQ